MASHEIDRLPIEEPMAALERLLISEYITAAGLNPTDLFARHDEQATRSPWAFGKCGQRRVYPLPR